MIRIAPRQMKIVEVDLGGDRESTRKYMSMGVIWTDICWTGMILLA